MATFTGDIVSLLRPGIKAIFGRYNNYPEEWGEIYKVQPSDKFQEIEVEMRFLGPAEINPEGQPGAVDTMGQRIITNYIHKRISKFCVLSKEAIEDNLYKNDFPMQVTAMRDSLRTTKNILGANLLNNAFNAAFPIGDGKALCAVDHPIDNGSFANTFPAGSPLVDFSEAGLEQALIIAQTFPMQSGLLAQTMGRKLIVPVQLQFAASRLLNSAFRTDTANNDISAIYHGDYIPEGYKINHYLLSPSNWYLLTDSPNGFKHYRRSEVEIDSDVDFSSKNIMFSATERYSFGCSNARAVFGAQAA